MSKSQLVSSHGCIVIREYAGLFGVECGFLVFFLGGPGVSGSVCQLEVINVA